MHNDSLHHFNIQKNNLFIQKIKIYADFVGNISLDYGIFLDKLMLFNELNIKHTGQSIIISRSIPLLCDSLGWFKLKCVEKSLRWHLFSVETQYNPCCSIQYIGNDIDYALLKTMFEPQLQFVEKDYGIRYWLCKTFDRAAFGNAIRFLVFEIEASSK